MEAVAPSLNRPGRRAPSHGDSARPLLRLLSRLMLLFVLCLPAFAQPFVRSVSGTVVDGSGEPIPSAVVQLKNTVTLQIRSYISDQDGNYHFHGLSSEIDYELRASHRGVISKPRTLTRFDSRREANIDLRIQIKE